jgi:hypothetical protein
LRWCGAPLSIIPSETIQPFPGECFPIYAEPFRPLCSSTEIRQVFSQIAVQHADARGLFDGLIWPKTGFASIV